MISARNPHRPRRLGVLALALGCIGLIGLTGCGSDGGGSAAATTSSASAGATTAPQRRESLKVGVAVIGVNFAPLFIAKNAGLFEQENLEVEIQNLAANVTNGVVSERVDLGVIGPGAALIPVKDGKDTSIIYNHVGNGLVALAGNKNITNAGQCKRVATLNPGSSMYGWAVAFKSGFSANYDVVPLGDIPSILAALTSGSTDCATLTVPQMSKPAADGTVKVLADPRNGSTMPKSDAIPVGLHEGAIWGLKSKLAGKEEALVRFTRAMDKALRFIKDNDDLTLAGLLRKENDIALTGDEKFLAGVIAENRYSFGPHGGLIDEKDWQACLTFLKASGLTFIDANDPKWGFDARVDMSFLEKGRTRG